MIPADVNYGQGQKACATVTAIEEARHICA
jgi:hypothetical protein